MTTPLLPTKEQLVASKYTPKELKDDNNFEKWLFEAKNDAYIKRLGFLRSLMTAYRDGQTSFSYTFDLLEETDYIESQIKDMSPEAQTNDYLYTVTRSNPTSRTLTVSWA